MTINDIHGTAYADVMCAASGVCGIALWYKVLGAKIFGEN